MNIKSKKLILLTGAGYTRNFGGFLAKEMWDRIFNNPDIQANKNLKTFLLQEFNYEYAYSIVMKSDTFSEKERNIMKRVVEEAYKSLDDATKNWTFDDDPESLNWYGLTDLLRLFFGSSQEQGFFFTLNQDIFMERLSGYIPLAMGKFRTSPIGEFTKGDFLTMPDEDNIKSITDISSYGDWLYVKLHGSYGWLSADGENRMVIGGEKEEQINDEPLLKWYFDIFEQILDAGDKKLLVLGCGFKDRHINEIILNAVKNSNLKIYIINPTAPQKFREEMEKTFPYKNDFGHFWKALSGYFPYTLKEIFPHSQSRHPTIMFKEIKKALLS